MLLVTPIEEKIEERSNKLTPGKVYQVRKDYGQFYELESDLGEIEGFFKWRFKLVGCDWCKERHCNGCKYKPV